MRKFLIVLFSACLMFLQFGCGGKDEANNGQANQTPTAETNQSNTAVKDTPLPEFTDAATALAEGDKLFDTNKIDLAIEAYNQAVKLDPDLAEAYFKLGVAYGLIEKKKEEVAKTTIEEPTPTPNSKKGQKEEEIKTESQKAFENAVKAYKKLLAANPKDDAAYYNLGRSYNKLDEDEEAEKALQQAVKLKPEDGEYQTALGEILIKLAQYDEAIRALKKALEIDPNNLQAEDFLDKAEAGKKRVDFGSTPKPVSPDDKKTKPTPKPKETETPNENIKPGETKAGKTGNVKKPE